MTPKEKAKQLYEKMKFLTEFNSQPSTVHGMCKKLALLCVDEIIKATQRETINDSGTGIDVIPMRYWVDVKQEISLL